MNLFRILAITVISVSLIAISAVLVSAQTIDTGDATAETVIENRVNTNIVTCCSPTPSQVKESPTPTRAIEQPTPTPTTGSGTGGPGDRSDGRSDGGSSSPQKQGEVLAAQTIAPTGSFGSIFASLEQAFGVIIVSAGIFLSRRTPQKQE